MRRSHQAGPTNGASWPHSKVRNICPLARQRIPGLCLYSPPEMGVENSASLVKPAKSSFNGQGSRPPQQHHDHSALFSSAGPVAPVIARAVNELLKPVLIRLCASRFCCLDQKINHHAMFTRARINHSQSDAMRSYLKTIPTSERAWVSLLTLFAIDVFNTGADTASAMRIGLGLTRKTEFFYSTKNYFVYY